MRVEVELTQDRATQEEIARHLQLCDMDFVPALSLRVQIAEYAEKMLSNATRFEAWERGSLAGLIAVYCNDRENRQAYISNLSVLPEARRQGVGTMLLDKCLRYLRGQGFTQVDLQVDLDNVRAIRFYELHGFQPAGAEGQSIIMRLARGGEV